jgi:hypothetical protein
VEKEMESALSRASELAARVYDDAVRSRDRGGEYALSFLKVAIGRPRESGEGVHYAGFHLDTHPEVDGTGGRELSRLLFNLADSPRRFRYAGIDRFELARRGHEVPRSDYQVVELPPGVEIIEIEIPSREATRVHALHFWAIVIPHVGADDEQGHFLASYEAVAPVSPI